MSIESGTEKKGLVTQGIPSTEHWLGRQPSLKLNECAPGNGAPLETSVETPIRNVTIIGLPNILIALR